MAQKQFVIEGGGNRPLAVALDQVEVLLGSPVNYEDVPCEHADDLEPVTDPRVRPYIAGRPSRVPRRGSVNVTLDPIRSEGDQMPRVNDVLLAYRRANLPGDFRVEMANGMLYVVATKTKGSDGKQRDVISPLAGSVVIPYAKRTVIETVSLITTALSKTAGVPVLVGQVPFAAEYINFGSQGESGRDALARLFREVNPQGQTSYRLLFDTLIHSYMLNLHALAPLTKSTEDPAAGVGRH